MKEKLEKELEDLKAKLEDARKRLPAHTIRPHQMMAIEELEERIEEIESKLEEQ